MKLTLLAIAAVCHEANRAYCRTLGDFSQPPWDEAPAWQQESALAGVQLHVSGDHGPEASHCAWSWQKIADGWSWGPEKDPERKLHPCLVEFDALPVEQQAKDRLFMGVVHSLRHLL